MSPKLSPAVSRALALALLAVVLILTVNGVIEPLVGAYGSAITSAEDLRSAIIHVQKDGRSLAALEAEVARLKSREQSTPGFLRGTNEALAAAELQEHLKDVVASVHGKLLSTLILPTHNDADVRRITVRGEMIADIAALQQACYALESGSPTLFLDNVEISPHPTQGPLGTTIESSLVVRFELYGYMRSPS